MGRKELIVEEIQVKIELYKIAWAEIGLNPSKSKSYISKFLKTPQYIKGYDKYWEKPLQDRLGVPDDMTRQQFVVFLTQEFISFIVSKLEYEVPEPLERTPQGEIST